MLSTPQLKEHQILTKLGLTPRQARAYLAIVKLGQPKISEISSESKIDRGNIYRIMSKLEQLGLVEKIISYPLTYKALPIPDAMAMLLAEKEKEQKTVKKEVKRILETANINNCTQNGADYQFAVIPWGKMTDRKINEMVEKTNKTYAALLNWTDVNDNRRLTVKLWRKLLTKEVHLRVVISSNQQIDLPRCILNLKEQYPNLLQIKTVTTPIALVVTIFDGSSALVSVKPYLPGPSLCTSNTALDTLFVKYFEKVWAT